MVKTRREECDEGCKKRAASKEWQSSMDQSTMNRLAYRVYLAGNLCPLVILIVEALEVTYEL
jgi:hypothetical protein